MEEMAIGNTDRSCPIELSRPSLSTRVQSLLLSLVAWIYHQPFVFPRLRKEETRLESGFPLLVLVIIKCDIIPYFSVIIIKK